MDGFCVVRGCCCAQAAYSDPLPLFDQGSLAAAFAYDAVSRKSRSDLLARRAMAVGGEGKRKTLAGACEQDECGLLPLDGPRVECCRGRCGVVL